MKNTLSIKHNQHLVMNLAMQKALHVLQMPLPELCLWIEKQIVENPLLELQNSSQSFHDHDYEMPTLPSLTSYLEVELMAFTFSKNEELVYKLIVHHLDSNGFLSTSFKELAELSNTSTLEVENMAHFISQMDPPGLATVDLQHCLLAQLEAKNKKHSTAYRILSEFWPLLSLSEFDAIAAQLHISTSDLMQVITDDIKILDPFPGQCFSHQQNSYVIPDLIITEVDSCLQLSTTKDLLPPYQISHYDVQSKEDRTFVRQWLSAAKWLDRIVSRRMRTLTRIGQHLLNENYAFFLGAEQHPTPLNVGSLANELDLNVSTISRALKDKYIDTPRGIYPLSFFTNSTCLGTSFHKSHLHAELLAVIDREDKQHPCSDDALAKQLADRGIMLSRRTVTKYRKQLAIPNQRARKMHFIHRSAKSG